MQKLIEARGWELQLVTYLSSLIRLCTSSMPILVTTLLSKGNNSLRKSLLGGYVYLFSSIIICEYLNIPIPKNFTFEKEYVLDDVAIESLGHKCVWPKTNVLRVADLTLKYNGLHKIALATSCPLNL